MLGDHSDRKTSGVSVDDGFNDRFATRNLLRFGQTEDIAAYFAQLKPLSATMKPQLNFG